MKIHVSSIPKVKPKLKNLVHFLVCGCSNSSTRFERPPTPTRHRCDFFALEPQFVANGCPANTCGQKQWPCLHGHCNRWCFLELDLCVSSALQKHVQASTCNAMVWAVLRELNGFLSFHATTTTSSTTTTTTTTTTRTTTTTTTNHPKQRLALCISPPCPVITLTRDTLCKRFASLCFVGLLARCWASAP